MDSRQKRIAVLLPNGPAYFSRIFAGIGAYCRGHHRWRIVAWPSFAQPLKQLETAILDLQVDGVIGQASSLWEKLVADGKLKFVNAEHSRHPYPSLPRVGLDEVGIARLSSDHFKQRGVRSLAVVSQAESLPAAERTIAFVESAATWCATQVAVYELSWRAEFDEAGFTRWIAQLPKPVGVFCWHDESAKIAHQVCESSGLRIPDDVLLIGVDNDDTICQFLDPALSSIDPNAQRIGYEAAALLDRLMDGQPAPTSPILVPPIGVVTRASSDIAAIDSPDVVRAMQFIREHAGSAVTIKDVLNHLNISRRSLETQFKAALGRSPRSEIYRILVERACDMLANTELPIPVIAERCGYRRPNHFTTMFRKQTRQTPSAYRKQTRLS